MPRDAASPEHVLDYDAAVRVLQGALLAAAANARSFGARSSFGHALLSARTWAELADIEAELATRLDASLRQELRTDAWTLWSRAVSWLRSHRDAWRDEQTLIGDLFREACELPLAAWRAANPQLEERIWPFFQQRTEHLANTTALALREPAPFPAIIWHPGRREFRR